MRERNTGINIRVTEKEKEIIVKKAEKCSLTVSEYLRQIGMQHDPKELPRQKIYDEMLRLDHQIELLQGFVRSENDPARKQNYETIMRNMRKLMQSIWRLLLSNFDTGKGGSSHGND